MAQPSDQQDRPHEFYVKKSGVWGALRRGCCLSVASFTPFSSTLPDFSKIRAALIFCFFCIKAKEKVFAILKTFELSCVQDKKKLYLCCQQD
jgi:hypothetical protein